MKSIIEKLKNNRLTKILLADIVRKKDKELFFENFSMMISSGIDIVVALKLLKSESKSRGIKKIIEEIQSSVGSGTTISDALKASNVLEPHLMAVVELGEESGNLSANLEIVVEQIKRERDFRSKIRSASIYPIFILLVMGAVGLAVATLVLPRLTNVYKNLRVDLPEITKIMIGVAEWLEQYGAIAVPVGTTSTLIIFYLVFFYKKTNQIGQSILLNTPVVKKLIIEVEVSRFGYLLGTLLKSGYPIVEALNLLEYSTSYYRYKNFYEYLQFTISSGFNFKDSISLYKDVEKVLPVYARQLIISSESTGKLADSLENIGKLFKKRNESTLKDLTVLVEPVLLVLIWIGVAFVAFAVILPVYNLVGNISQLSRNQNETTQIE